MHIPDAFEWATYGAILKGGGFAELPWYWFSQLKRRPPFRQVVERDGEPWPSGVRLATPPAEPKGSGS